MTDVRQLLPASAYGEYGESAHEEELESGVGHGHEDEKIEHAGEYEFGEMALKLD